MRPIALSDECLSDFDQDELNEFESSNGSSEYRAHKKIRDEQDESLLDLLTPLSDAEGEEDADAGIVDYE